VAGVALGLALVLVLYAPARWLGDGLARVTAGRLQLADAQGTLWRGSAWLLLTGGRGSQDAAALPSRVHWRLRLSGLALAAQIRADCCTRGAQGLTLLARPRWGGLRVALADGQILLPASILSGLGTPLNTLAPRGQLALATQGLSVEWSAHRLALHGRADFTARHVASRLSTLEPLGSYRMTLIGGDAPSLQLSTLEGVLQLSGTGQWVGARLRFTGEAMAAPGMQVQLANLLNLLGRRRGNGAVLSFG
jgi:general secretion pathway protein N